MSDNGMELTRRKILAGAGAVGVAGAAAGFGSSAFFSDQETFVNNQLVAGSLDLKVDWEEHYSDWSPDEDDGLQNDIAMSQPQSLGDYRSFPVGSGSPSLWIHDDDVGQFMDNTSIEAFPDGDGDGVQDDLEQYDACEDFADTPAALDPTQDLRTQNGDTYDSEAGEALPLINLTDVKPGDFGELTLSFHLCDNPGYVWLRAANVEAAENGVNEAEADDDDESGPPDEVSTDPQTAEVELLDAIETAWWYDNNCNNLTDGGGGGSGNVCVELVLDDSGSMGGTRIQNTKDGAKSLAQAILSANASNRVGVSRFDSSGSNVQELTDNLTDVDNAIDDLVAGGGTNAQAGVNAGQQDLEDNCPEGHDRVMVVFGDGDINTDGQSAKDAGTEIFAVGVGGATEASLAGLASDPDETHVFLGATDEEIEDLFNQVAQTVLQGEAVFFQGSLRESLVLLSSGNGAPLAGDIPAAEGGGADGSCFSASSTHCIGFSWWLPVDHANEIQSDSVEFDLGFYTEQCRHNDGGGEFGNARSVGNT